MFSESGSLCYGALYPLIVCFTKGGMCQTGSLVAMEVSLMIRLKMPYGLFADFAGSTLWLDRTRIGDSLSKICPLFCASDNIHGGVQRGRSGRISFFASLSLNSDLLLGSYDGMIFCIKLPVFGWC